ncbi:MAG: hypothetical protein AAGJ32_10600 [Pseudomonadota bacterium]
MRCSDCFGEMVENEGLIQCTSCGRILQAIPDEPERNFMAKIGVRSGLQAVSLPVPLPIAVAGAALTVITSAVLASYLLPRDGDVGGSTVEVASNGNRGSTTAPAVLIDGPWQSGFTSLPADSRIVSASPSGDGFAVVLERSDPALAETAIPDSTMQVSYFDGAGTAIRTVRPVLPQSWFLTHALPLDDGHTLIQGQTEDGLFLFRIDREGQPIWGRFEGAGDESNLAASLHPAGDMAVIASLSPRGLGLGLVAYDEDGRRLWSETLSGLIAGGYTLAGTLTGDIMVAADVAADGAPTRQSRFIRLDRSGVVQLDQPLELLPGNTPRRIAVAPDGGAYLISDGAKAMVHRLSPRGAEQWRADLSGIPADGTQRPNVAVMADGAVVTRADRNGLHIARVDASGVSISSVSSPVPADLDVLGLRTETTSDIVQLVLMGQDPASAQLVHLEGDLQEILNAEPSRSGRPNTAPTRTVSVEGLPPPQPDRRAITGQAGPADLRRTVDPEPPVRRPAIDAQRPQPVAAQSTEGGARTRREPEPEPTLAECAFTCMPDGVPAAKYPVTKAYSMAGGATLNDVTLEAFADHDILCLQSGGLAHAGSVPICEKR